MTSHVEEEDDIDSVVTFLWKRSCAPTPSGTGLVDYVRTNGFKKAVFELVGEFDVSKELIDKLARGCMPRAKQRLFGTDERGHLEKFCRLGASSEVIEEALAIYVSTGTVWGAESVVKLLKRELNNDEIFKLAKNSGYEESFMVLARLNLPKDKAEELEEGRREQERMDRLDIY